MTNIIRCQRCEKNFILEEFSGHDCHPYFKDVQSILIDYYFVAPKIDKNGDKVIIVKGLNGILYRLVKCPHNPPHTNTYPTTFDREEIRRRFDRTLIRQIYN